MKLAEYKRKIKKEQRQRVRKYKNKKCIINGIKFDSIKEGKRYIELDLMEKNGVIKELELQPKFELIPTIHWGDKTLRKMSYIADFKYYNVESNEWIVEDVKGFKTDVYKVKQKVFLHLYGDVYKFIES